MKTASNKGAKPKAKRRVSASTSQSVPDRKELAKKEVHQLVESREGAMEHLCIHETDCSIKVCRVDRTIILGELLFASPTRDLALRIEDGALSHLISWSDELPILKSLLGK